MSSFLLPLTWNVRDCIRPRSDWSELQKLHSETLIFFVGCKGHTFKPFLVSCSPCSGHVCLFAYTNLFTHETVYSSPSLLNEYLRYDKLWGPSQRVVTLFHLYRIYQQISIFPPSGIIYYKTGSEICTQEESKSSNCTINWVIALWNVNTRK